MQNNSAMVSLKLNPQKTTVMWNVEKVNIVSDDEDNNTITNCKVLVILITNDSYTNEETKKRIYLSKVTNANLTKIMKSFMFQPTQRLSYCT